MHLGIDTGKTHGASCVCPACLGLECLNRPRYFSGQLLSEAELNDEQAYLRAKMKLHNRYLHGTGVVCGLQVTCDDCGGIGTTNTKASSSNGHGFVTIEPGYAIDPCGNDIVVCDTKKFDVIEYINNCEKERKQQRKSDCAPLSHRQESNCKDIERHYCLTIAYNEVEMRFAPSLRQGSNTTGATHGKSCSCGCGGSQSIGSASTSTMSSSMAANTANGQSKMPIGCEPTRIYEQYQFGLVEVPPDYCGNLQTRLEHTLLAKVIDCFTTLKSFLGRLMTSKDYQTLGQLFFNGTTETQPQALYTSYRNLQQTVYDLYCQNPLQTRCQSSELLARVRCQEPHIYEQRELTKEEHTCYIEQFRAPLNNLLALLLQYVLECVCQALLPPCPPSQCDDRLILACLTVKNHKIVEICDFCHRQYAGSFPTLRYWLSLTPILPLIAYAIERICCYDWLSYHEGLENGLTQLLNRIDPGGNMRKAFFARDYAWPKSYSAIFDQLINKLSPGKLTDLFHPEAFNLATVLNTPVAQATEAMIKAGVTPLVQNVASAEEAPTLDQLRTRPFAQQDDRIMVYQANDTVVGYTAYSPSGFTSDVEGLQEQMKALQDRLNTLEKEVQEYRAGRGPAPEPPQ